MFLNDTQKDKLPTLPAPSWTQSDNNLLPLWIKYLQNHSRQYRYNRLEEVKETIRVNKDAAENEYPQVISDLKQKVETYKSAIAELEGNQIDDAHIEMMYLGIITNPNVAGTRLNALGDLVVLIDPKIEGAAEYELGMFELGSEYFREGMIRMVHHDDRVMWVMSDHFGSARGLHANDYGSINVYFGVPDKDSIGLMTFNVEQAINTIVERIRQVFRHRRETEFHKKKETRRADQPWSGYVEDPLRAMKRLLEFSKVRTLEAEIENHRTRIESANQRIRSYQETIRELRRATREAEAELKKLQAMATTGGIDVEEAKRSLKFISALDGVIAIKFQPDGTPTLHVRNSIVSKGRRYDLGDFELHLKTEVKGFGTVLKVRRTRVPLGGSYEAGWHDSQQGFCFGNRNSEIIKAFTEGDLAHAVNAALGTMNSVTDAEYYGLAGMGFAEIPMNAIWKRHIRQRPRRIGRAALKAAELQVG